MLSVDRAATRQPQVSRERLAAAAPRSGSTMREGWHQRGYGLAQVGMASANCRASCNASDRRFPLARANVTTDLLTPLPVPRSTVVWVRLPDGAVLFTPEDEVYYSMNAAATLIWESLPGVADMDALCSSVRQCFPGAETDQIRADVIALLDELAGAGLVDCPDRKSAA